MAELEFPANPINYAVWYSYFRGDSKDLVLVVDKLLESCGSAEPMRFLQIFREFVSGERVVEQVEEISGELEEQIAEVITHMREASSENEDFSADLADYSLSLAERNAGGEVDTVVRQILVKAQSVLAKNKSLEQKLRDSGERISLLQNSIHEVCRDARTDGLTGIANRKFFDRRLKEECEQAIEEDTSLCLQLIDIDHFKKFNDRYGHSVGDSVLKAVARNLTDNVKGADLAARFGGEEFAIILPQTELENAIILANKICTKSANKNLKSRSTGDSYGHITVSIGVACYRPGEPLSDFINRADKSLYSAKAQGRNRVVSERELESLSSAEAAV